MREVYIELCGKLSRLQWLLQRYHLQNHAERGPMADPTRGQGRVLAILKMQTEISTKDLSYLLGIRQQSLNELLNKLEKSGYVERTPSEADRRVMVVRLTEKGKSQQYTDPDFSGIFDCLNEEEQKAFGEYLNRVIAALEEQFDDRLGDRATERIHAARSRIRNDFDYLHTRQRDRNPFDRYGYDFGESPQGPHFDSPADPYDDPDVPPALSSKDQYDSDDK